MLAPKAVRIVERRGKATPLEMIARYVSLARRRSGLMLLAFAVLAGLALVPILQLELHTDLAELLPDNDPGVAALRQVGPRQIAASNLVVIVESPDREANRKFVESLRPALAPLVPGTFSEVQWRPETEIAEYASKQRWLYASLDELNKAESFLERLIASRTNPFFVDIEEDPEVELKKLRERLNKKLPVKDESPYFEFENKPEKGEPFWSLGVMMWRRGGGLAALGDEALVQTVKQIVERTQPARFHPRMKVEYSGHIPIALEEHAAVREDLSIASLVCISLVLLVIYLFFRRAATVLVVGAPAVMGLLLALVLARFTIHFLNANTAFLISIILGNGINTPIIQLARYGEERRRGEPVDVALTRALVATFPATLAATAAASIAYGSLLVTNLRGLNQFGLVGGAGMLLVWAMSFLLVPPLVLVGEKLKPGLLTPRPNLWRRPFAALGRLIERAPLAVAALIAIGTAVAFVPAWRYARDPLEYNFDNLRSSDPNVARKWGMMYDLGMGNVGAGYIARDGVILVDDAKQADPVAEALRQKDKALGDKSILETVRTLSSTLPADQPAKLEVLAHIRKLIDRNMQLMEDDEKAEVQAWRPPNDLHVLAVADLPHRIRENFTEVDGTIGRFVGIDADPARYTQGDGRELIRLSRSLEVDALGKHWVAAASSTVFAGMLKTIMHDGPRLTVAAVIGVTLLVFLAFGPRGGLVVLLPLAIGVLWLVSLLGLFDLKLNFLNFVAVPITLGIGTDYAANLWVRLRREPSTPVHDVVSDTGSAVALCSSTTIIGYSSLILAHNRALQSFGKVANLGEVTCLIAALVVLPCLVWLARRGKATRITDGEAERKEEAGRA